MPEKKIFENTLEKLIEDWNNTNGANFSKVAEYGLHSYTYANDIFKEIRTVSKKEKITQSDFEHLKNLLEKQIELYSSLEFKAEIYRQAATKIDRIKDRFESDDGFDLEDVGTALLYNLEIGFDGTIFKEDPLLIEIGEIGANMEWGNANLEDWNRILKELKPRLTTEINSKD